MLLARRWQPLWDQTDLLVIPGVLREAREGLVSGVSSSDIWKVLYSLEKVGRRWPAPKTIAEHHLRRLITVLNGGLSPILGLSVHQAKGLQ